MSTQKTSVILQPIRQTRKEHSKPFGTESFDGEPFRMVEPLTAEVYKEVVTRFAPSPTGFLTLGNYRTALFNFLFARQHGGKFILRIEDTDKERSKKEFEEDILESFKWLNLSYNEFYRQSDRQEIYRNYLQKLLDEGKAYVSKESDVKEGESPSTELRTRRSEVIRFKNSGQKVCFKDLIRGEICFDTTELGDFVIAKSIDEPIFHFAVVVDDFEMGVTHVIRGEDHISNTPRHILLGQALGAPQPIYAHLPLMLATDRSKLSKRNGAISIRECKEKGYLPEAIINCLALLGWNPGTDQEILSLENLLAQFNLEKIQKGGAVFNEEKLNWLNHEYMKKLPKEALVPLVSEWIEKSGKLSITDTALLEKIAPLIIERVEKFEDITKMATAGELDYFFTSPDYPIEKLIWKDGNKEDTKTHLTEAKKMLETLSDNEFTVVTIREKIWEYAEKNGRGNVLWPLRFALSGKDKSPDPFTLGGVLGKTETLKRLGSAISKL
ncbi:MAG: glutamate--tRNA ligase [Patescibacteria group bacterium]